MKNTIKIITAFFLLTTITAFSQDISFKKGIVIIDGKDCLKYDSDAMNVSYQNLNGDDLMILKYIRVNDKLYTKVVFIESNLEFTSESYIFTKKLLVEKLLKSNALVDCNLVEEKLRTFVLKYDEKVEERLRNNTNNNNNNTVIIKEEPSRSGININLGR